ncbi:MAG: nucleoside deaminase [Alphaproteobacteria bacterium]
MTLPMSQLLTLAAQAAVKGEVPIAACVVGADGRVLAHAHNEVEIRQDATAHAELLVIQEACRGRGEKYLADCTLYVTLEPCAMCAQAASLVKIKKIIFGAYDAKGGGVEHGARVFAQATCHHAPEVVGGVMDAECGQLLQDFFVARRYTHLQK